MNTFMGDNFMLHNDAAEHLYHSHAANMPIVDFHCHLDPKQIAENKRFGDMTEIWLGGDHYKWRAMRANGVDESFITGDKPAFDKFCKWAETVPYTMRNPLYHWTHLELKRIFGIDKLLNPASAAEIYEAGNALLQTDAFSAQAIMQRMKVEVVCTTDDPADSLEYHQQIAAGSCTTRVLPTWRPDKSILVENPTAYNTYIEQLEQASGISITTFADLMTALKQRHDFFASVGCRISDHSIDRFYGEPFTDAQLAAIFDNVRTGKTLAQEDVNTFKAGMLYHLAVMDAEKDWAQQFHIGATRNNNTKMFRKLGADTGFDAI
ncbi:MAG: glucuronate isomerase, partial [Tannerellaceae bacterium]